MAFALRLQIEYKDINDIDTRIEVHQKDYVGVATYRDYADGEIACELAWGDQGEKQLPLVYGSQVTLYFDAETDYEFLDFFSSNSRKNKIFVYKNESLIHVAFSEADTWSEPLIAAPYGVSLTGYDGLGLLAKEDFLDENKNYYEGEMTPLAILQLILTKTGLDLPLNTSVSIRPLGASLAEDALTQVLKDVVSYRDLSCFEVLERLFQGCRLFQRAGEWFIVSNDFWRNETITFYAYTAAGAANGVKVINTVFSGFWFEGEPSLEFAPALKQMTIVQDYGFKNNLINNGGFGELDNGSFDGWEANGTAPQQRVYDTDGNKYVCLPGKESISDWKNDTRTKYLRTEDIRVEESDSIPTFSFDYALMGADSKPAYVYFGIHLISDTGLHFNLGSRINDKHEIEYYWETTSVLKGMPVKDEVYSWKPLFHSREYTRRAVEIESYPYSEITDHFTAKTIDLKEGIPASGKLRMYLFLADSTRVEIAGSCWRNVKLKFADENNEELPTETELLLVNDRENNFVPDDLELPQGDFPNIPNKRIVYTGGFIKNYGLFETTDLWVVDGVASQYSYTELIARFIASEMRLARQVYKAALADASPTTALVFSDANNGNKKYVEAGITYNDRMETIEGSYIELTSLDLDVFTVGKKTSYSSPKNSGGSSSVGSAVANTDELVGLADEGFAKVNQPGYLSADEFLGEVDPDSGRVVLKLDLEVICKGGRKTI